MNFFFGINNQIFKSELQIPIFKNRELNPLNLNLYKCYPKNNKWILEDASKFRVNEYFFILKNQDISEKDLFFLADKSIHDSFDYKKLKNFNNYTDSFPAYRANLKIFEKHNNGFSSYQSEYPYSMVPKKGSIVSAINSLSDPQADKNYILIKNIFAEPIEENFKGYLVDYNKKRIEEEFNLKTNYLNCIEVNNKLIKPDIFFVTKNYLGVPMYVSIKNEFISFEHTHPPHEYVLSDNRYTKISEFKKKINEIIS